MRHETRDLTIIYLTVNKLPDRWVNFQLGHLRKAAGEAEIISISRLPMNLGRNVLDPGPFGYWNIYQQLLRGAIMATTPFVAMAEDDTLYTYEHYHEFRPPMNAVSYDRSRWSLFTWDPIYCMRQRISNCSLVAPRDYLIEALTERSKQWQAVPPPAEIVGEVGRPVVDRRLRVSPRQAVEWYCTNPIVHLNHPTGTDVGHHVRADGRRMVKKHGQIKAIEIPYWGKAAEIASVYNGE